MLKSFIMRAKKDILSQYILFTRFYDEQRKIFDDKRLAIKETIQICKDEDILRNYIKKYEKEPLDITGKKATK